MFRLVFFAIGPGIGAAVDTRGYHEVLLWVGAGMTTAAVLGWLAVAATSRSASSTGSGTPPRPTP